MSRRPVTSAHRGARRWGAVAALALLAGCAPPPDLSGAAAGRNVILVSLDTVRADHLNSYGYDVHTTSPTLDALLARGVRFERAMAPRAMTWPSLGSVLTGLYPSAHGLILNGYKFRRGFPTLPVILQGAGYQTGAFLSNMCQARHQGLDRRYCSRSIDGRLLGEALGWLDERDPGRPFLLWVHYFAAHPPYRNGSGLVGRMDPGYSGVIRPKAHALDRIMIDGTPLADADLRHLNALYDASILRTDQRIALLLEGLRKRRLLDDSIVVFLSDHGEDLFEHHGYLYHACSVYQSGLHVPLGFVAPGLIPEREAVSPPVELVDVTPTLLDLLGIATPGPLHGRSLVPMLEDPRRASRPRPAFSEFNDTRLRTVFDGSWTLIDNPDEHLPRCFKQAPDDLYPIAPVELYDLDSDRGEQRNVAAEHPEQVQRLRSLIARRFASLDADSAPERQEIPDDLRRRLEALGYVGD